MASIQEIGKDFETAVIVLQHEKTTLWKTAASRWLVTSEHRGEEHTLVSIGEPNELKDALFSFIKAAWRQQAEQPPLPRPPGYPAGEVGR